MINASKGFYISFNNINNEINVQLNITPTFG